MCVLACCTGLIIALAIGWDIARECQCIKEQPFLDVLRTAPLSNCLLARVKDREMLLFLMEKMIVFTVMLVFHSLSTGTLFFRIS